MVSYPTDTPILSAYRKLAGAVTKPRDNFPVNVFTMYPKRQTSLSNGASRGHTFSVNVLLTFTPLCSEKRRVQPLLSYPSSPKAQLDAAQRPIRVPLSRSRTLGFSPPHPPPACCPAPGERSFTTIQRSQRGPSRAAAASCQRCFLCLSFLSTPHFPAAAILESELGGGGGRGKEEEQRQQQPAF